MAIGLIFQFAGEVVQVNILNKAVYFRTPQANGYTTIEGLKLSKGGVTKEFPDLADKENWREEAIKRFKEKINTMETDMQVSEYIISDLTKYGYKPLYRQRSGYRVEKIWYGKWII